MKTSNFARSIKDPGAVCIARGVPRFAPPGLLMYQALAPDRAWLKLPPDQYNELFTERLERLDPQKVWDDLHALTRGVEPILLCWEAPGDRCHRRHVAEWLENALGVEITEVGFARCDCLDYKSMKRKKSEDAINKLIEDITRNRLTAESSSAYIDARAEGPTLDEIVFGKQEKLL